MKFKEKTDLLLLICFLIFPPFPAQIGHAEEVSSSRSEQNTSLQNTSLESITVTAQKREENVQDVPISMSILSDIFITDAGIKDVKDLSFFTPNLYSQQVVNQNMMVIRGISSHSVALNTPVGLFVDDIGYPLTLMQNPDLLDIERIEVLRGPQGTLYGRNTEAGAVNIITKQPDNEARGKVFVEPAFYDTPDQEVFSIRTGATVSGPIVKDTLFFGVSCQYENSDGYTENIYDNDDKAAKIDHLNGQAKLRWKPSDPLNITMVLNGYENNDGYGYLRYIDGPAQSDRYKINWDGSNEWADKNNGQALRINYSGAAYNLVSITTRNDYSTDFINDGEFGPTVYPDQVFIFEDTVYSQEVRISSADEASPLTWIVGIYGFTEEVDAHAEYFGSTYITNYECDGFAVFGQGTYTLFDRLHLTAGLRYDYQDYEGEQTLNSIADPYGAQFDHGEWLPKASISYDINASAMAYATVARGMLAGGYDYGFASSSDTLAFKPEFSWNYETGLKTSWFDNKLTINIAVFYIDIEDKQVQEYLNGGPLRDISNAAKASSKGFELEMTARPFSGWQIFAGIGYADAQFEEWESEQATGEIYNFEGNNLTHAPEYTFNAGVQYHHSSGFFGRVDVTGLGDYYTDARNSVKVDGYETVNLKLGFEGESFQVSFWCKNVFDEAYLTTKSYYFGGHTAQDGAPRIIGSTFIYRF
ncbi:TonB-dependent receptor [Desulfobacter curvatus]|uniref:TonB-dependent receptor n=1 Tax=Desulfobacter curvatus TaxID=2290 RepID=UPI000374EEFE|nr:TonB-dependent receptor [Desulfobacter curvatus]